MSLCTELKPQNKRLRLSMLTHTCDKSKHFFYKRWAGISKYTRTTSLLNHIKKDDFLGLQALRGKNRRNVALYYANGLHNKICKIENCYTITTNCTCIDCDKRIHDQYHALEDCDSLDSALRGLHELQKLQFINRESPTL